MIRPASAGEGRDGIPHVVIIAGGFGGLAAARARAGGRWCV